MSRRKRQGAAPAPGAFPYVERGLQYARDVAEGRIPANRWTRLACQRQLQDLARWEAGDASWPYVWSPEAGQRAAAFFHQVPHTQGPLAFRHPDGEWNRLVLEPWQCFIETTIYGWLRRDSPPHRPVRRFARVYEEEPRGNGKSLRLSGAMLYAFTEGEQGVEAYSAAVDRGQAQKVWGEAAEMLRKRPKLAQALGLEAGAHAIVQLRSHGKALALSREAKKSADGLNIYFAAVDELHAHKTREVWDVLDTGTGKRLGNALIRIITTAGFSTHGICYEKRTYATKILEGAVSDETWFVVIYGMEEDDSDDMGRWMDRECRDSGPGHAHPSCRWRMANPNWAVSVDPIDFASKMQRAEAVESERNGVLTKHLNVWCNADMPWMSMPAWDACADQALSIEDFKGSRCVVGVDLASKTDICAKVRLFWRDLLENGPDEPSVRHFYVFLTSWLPKERIAASPNSQYDGWCRAGHITTTPGRVLDFAVVRKSVQEDAGAFMVVEFAFDPWQAQQMASELENDMETVEMRPTVANFSAPMKEIASLVLQGRIHHDGNPVLRWMVSNVVQQEDAKGNIYPRKQTPENKIDGVVALIMAMGRAMLAPEDSASESYLEHGEPLVLG